MDVIQSCYQKHICLRKDEKKYRSLSIFDNVQTCVDFSSNDYLGLSRNKLLIEAAIAAGEKFGTGATGSRLLSGNLAIFQQFEEQIAKDKRTQAALIFSSGFQCNISTLSSLLDKKVLKDTPVVFFDRSNHASLYQAVFLSKTELVRYRHNDMQHLNYLLLKYKNDSRPKFIVTESIFGMDGDLSHIQTIALLAKKYNAFLYLDEAHATGMIGINGYGLSTMLDLNNIPHVIMGTFSKALGASGGYIACSNIIKDYLINFCPGFIYSTANSPLVIGAAFKAWKMLPSLEKERIKIQERSCFLRNRMKEIGLDIGTSCTHIVSIFFKKEDEAIMAQKKLLEFNVRVSCIRPPTVPPGRSCLRIAINALHSDEDIQQLIVSMIAL